MKDRFKTWSNEEVFHLCERVMHELDAVLDEYIEVSEETDRRIHGSHRSLAAAIKAAIALNKSVQE